VTNTELLKAAPVAANRAAAAVAVRRPVVAAPDQDSWAGVKTLLEIGFAVVRVVEIAILFA
jgi:hypothetical protein